MIEWSLFLAVWLLLLAPLLRVTAALGGRGAPVIAAPPGEATRMAWVRVRFSEPPDAFRLYSGGAVVWDEAAPETDMEQPAAIHWGDAGPDLELEAEWADAGWRASEVQAVDPEGRRAGGTHWREAARWRTQVAGP